MLGPREIPYELLAPKRGMTTKEVTFNTPITGYNVRLHREVRRKWVSCELFEDGTLVVYPNTKWDFGTGALDTPDVVRASLAHDMFCHLTNLGLIPWKCRKDADDYYRDLLVFYGCPKPRAYNQWLWIRKNSKFNAYWRRDESVS